MTGIYQIRNTVNGKLYVGSAKSMRVRWGKHRSALALGKHHSRHLQAAWNKYGAVAFVFEPLLVCEPDMLLFYEQRCLDGLKPQYNVCTTAGNSLGVVVTEERKAKIRDKARGRKLTDSHKAAIAKSGVGRVPTAEARVNMSAAQRRRVLSPEVREASASRAASRNTDPVTKAKMLASRKSVRPVVTAEERAARSARMREMNLKRSGRCVCQ